MTITKILNTNIQSVIINLFQNQWPGPHHLWRNEPGSADIFPTGNRQSKCQGRCGTTDFAIFVGNHCMLAVREYFCCFFPPISHQTKKYESIQRNTDNESSLSVFRELVLKCDPQRENKGVLVAFDRIYLYLCVSNL